MEVDQAWDDHFARRVDDVTGGVSDIGLDRHNPAGRDPHVADRVEPQRGIDDAPTLDDQVMVGREQL